MRARNSALIFWGQDRRLILAFLSAGCPSTNGLFLVPPGRSYPARYAALIGRKESTRPTRIPEGAGPRHGFTKYNEPFQEQTWTLVVGPHGDLLALAASVERGQKLRLTHRATGQAQECRVVYVGPDAHGKNEVAIEFIQAAPMFWQVDFPPPNWQAPLD